LSRTEREDIIKDWILETIKNTVHSAKLEKDALLLWRKDQKVNGSSFRYHFQFIGILHAKEGVLRGAFDYTTPGTYALLRNPSLTVSYSNNKLTQLSKNILEAIKNEGKFELLESGQVKTLS